MEADGAVGWQPIRYNTIRVDAVLKQATWLTNAPPETATWLKFRIRRQSRILSLEIPGRQDNQGVLTVDTGSSCGVALSPERWRAWTSRPYQPARDPPGRLHAGRGHGRDGGELGQGIDLWPAGANRGAGHALQRRRAGHGLRPGSRPPSGWRRSSASTWSSTAISASPTSGPEDRTRHRRTNTIAWGRSSRRETWKLWTSSPM